MAAVPPPPRPTYLDVPVYRPNCLKSPNLCSPNLINSRFVPQRVPGLRSMLGASPPSDLGSRRAPRSGALGADAKSCKTNHST